MKKILPLIVIANLFLLAFDSCTNQEEYSLYPEGEYTRSSESLSLTDHVRLADIQTLISQNSSKSSAKSTAQTQINCISEDLGDTLLYVCNKIGGGWTIYSSDKRVPPIVAESEEGSFEDVMQNEEAMFWIKSMAQDMYNIKNCNDCDLNFTSEEISTNKEFWELVTTPDENLDEYLKDKMNSPNYAIRDSTTVKPLIPNGHYEYHSSYSTYEVYDSIARLTTTDWHQHNPFNMYCPYKSNLSTRAPAGCVAISCVQMLYFLHNKYGIPRTAPSEAYCNGNVNSSDYDWNQTNYTAEIWDEMTGNGSAAAPLIADIGRRVNMIYGDEGSAASTRDLVDKVFTPYGVSSIYTTYDTEILKTN